MAEDEAAVRAFARTVLSGVGLGVIEAQDGREAVEVFRQRRAEVGCVLLDLTMPGLGGLAAACVLAARGYAVTLFEKSAWLGGKAAVP